MRHPGKIRGQRRMPLMSNPVRLIDDRGAIGLRHYQHADENCEQADEAGEPHGFTSQETGRLILERGNLLGYVAQGEYSNCRVPQLYSRRNCHANEPYIERSLKLENRALQEQTSISSPRTAQTLTTPFPTNIAVDQCLSPYLRPNP